MAPKRTTSSKKKGKQPMQQSITVHALPLLKEPLKAVGKLVGFPGSFWEGRMTPEELATVYKCATKDYTLTHRFSPGASPEPAFHMQEMGVNGTGSTEHGDASGELFYVRLQTYLKYYYATYPDEMPKPKGEQQACSARVDLTDGQPREDLTRDDEPGDFPDVLADFPHLRLSRAPVMGYFTITADKLIEMGPKSGQYKATFECIIKGCDGCNCGAHRDVPHKKGKGVSTSNLITHLRQMAASCPKHKEALAVVDAANASVITLESGDTVKVFNFSESFAHHLDFLYLRATGLFSQKLIG